MTIYKINLLSRISMTNTEQQRKVLFSFKYKKLNDTIQETNFFQKKTTNLKVCQTLMSV